MAGIEVFPEGDARARTMIDYTGGNMALPGRGRAIQRGERVACNCCGELGTVIETETGVVVLRYCIEWDSGPVIWMATNHITPLDEAPTACCCLCRTNHPRHARP